MHSHKAKQISELLDNYLPDKYTAQVRKKLKERTDYDGQDNLLHIRHVRIGRVSNAVVFEILIELASTEKVNLEKLSATANKALSIDN